MCQHHPSEAVQMSCFHTEEFSGTATARVAPHMPVNKRRHAKTGNCMSMTKTLNLPDSLEEDSGEQSAEVEEETQCDAAMREERVS